MAMTKQDFIKIADAIREHNQREDQRGAVLGIKTPQRFQVEHLAALADVFEDCNPKFDRVLWKQYIDGECGPNGGPKTK